MVIRIFQTWMQGMVLAVALLAGRSLRGQNDLKDIPSVDPEVERSSFQVPEGLQVNLFAGEPMLKKPTQIAWDQRGRLWVASSETYPQIKPGDELNDEILILEDTNNDGKADKVTKFADHLLIPTGLFPADGGCYVANSTQVLFLRDTDGDGKADERKIVLSGFGTEDTHHIIHAFRGGPDGLMYFNQSVYIHTRVETPWGPRQLGGSGIWQLRPETGQLEIFTRGQVNPWGHIFDRWGQSFTTDGAYGEGINYAFPGAAFFWAKGVDDWTKDFPRILKGLNPGQPKQCGLEIISGRHFPITWYGSMLAPDFRGNRINRFLISENASGYASKQVEDVIKTNHRAFRPVDVKLGPDGALYVADWYNPIIQHGEVDFRDDRRDHTHGRIWRLTWKDRPLVAKPKIAGAKIEALLGMLKAPEDWTRFFAKRELKDRAAGVASGSSPQRAAILTALDDWVKNLDPNDADRPHALLEAAWVRSSLLADPLGLVGQLLDSKEPRAVTAGIRSLYQLALVGARGWRGAGFADDELITKIDPETGLPMVFRPVVAHLANAHPRVRLEAIHCLRALHTARATELALNVLDKEMDENLDYALWLTCRETQDVWLPAFQKGELTFGGNGAHVVFALKATGNAGALAPLVAALKGGKIAAKDRAQVLQLIGTMGGADDLALLLALPSSGPERVKLIELVTSAVRGRKVPPSQPEKSLALLDDADASVRAAGARLCGALKLEPAREKFIAWLGDPGTEAAAHQAAFDGLVALGGDATRRAIVAVIDKSDAPLGQRGQAIQALATIDVKDAATRAVAFLENEGAASVAPALFDTFVTRKNGPASLAAALAGKSLPEAIAQVGLQKASAAPGDSKGLQEALAAAGHLTPVSQTMTPDEMASMVSEVKAKGNPIRGESVYRRVNLLCQTCHGIAGGGPEVGPNLVSIGASAQIDYLIESLIAPSAKIKEGFHTSVITTTENEVLAGAITANDDQKITLRDAVGVLHDIPKSQVAKNEIQPLSLMPPGLTASLRKDEFLDLVSFLSQLGREGAFKAAPQNYNRRWRVLNGSAELNRAHSLGGDRLFATEDPALVWTPGYSATDGTFPLAELPVLQGNNGVQRRVIRCDVEVTTPGRATLAFNDPEGLTLLCADQKPLEAAAKLVLDLPAGLQHLTLYFDPAGRTSPLRLEWVDEPGTTARVRWSTGR